MEFNDSGSGAIHLFILGLVCGVVFFANLGRLPFYDKAEPREALVVRDIVTNGNWIFPLRMGQQIPSKPPLFHWTGAVCSIVWGRLTETTVRFPSALFASLGVLLIYCLGRQLYDSLTGLFAGLILATFHIYQTAGIEARVDMTLTFWLTLSLVLFYGIYSEFLRSPLWTYAFFLAAGAGVLAKGPVSLVLCALTMALFLAFKKRWDLLRKFALHPGIILAALVFSLWYGSALWIGGQKFFGIQFIKENFARFFMHGEAGTGHQKPVYYFISYLFTLGLPWTLLLPFGLVDYFQRKRFKEDGALFLGIWVAVVFIFFSLSAGKRPPYILPLYPPLALVMALGIQGWKAHPGSPKGIRVVAWCAALMGLIILVTALSSALPQGPFSLFHLVETRLKAEDLQQFQAVRNALNATGWVFPGVLLGAALLWFLIARSLWRYQWTLFVAQLAGIAALSFFVVQALFMPLVASQQSYKAFVETARQAYGIRGTLYVYPKGIDYASIVFYGGKQLKVLSRNDALLFDKLEHSGDYVIVGENTWKTMIAHHSVSRSPVLRSKGTGPDGDNALILVRGVKSDSRVRFFFPRDKPPAVMGTDFR
jgi:Dolichyl-phosphate-mannose-protein mannosyltransferase